MTGSTARIRRADSIGFAQLFSTADIYHSCRMLGILEIAIRAAKKENAFEADTLSARTLPGPSLFSASAPARRKHCRNLSRSILSWPKFC
jgi:hypothetical protein